MGFHIHRRTFYTVLIGYMEHYGHLINNADQLRVALKDLEELTDFALYKMDTAIDSDAAKEISDVGLEWLDYAKAHPDNPQGYAATAQEKLENTPEP